MGHWRARNFSSGLSYQILTQGNVSQTRQRLGFIKIKRKKKGEMTIKLSLIVCVTFAVLSCTSQNKSDCHSNYLNHLQNCGEYRRLKTAFHDSLSSWFQRSLPGVRAYQSGEFDWKLDDVVFFSKDSGRAILFMSKVRKLPDRVDEIKAFTAMKIEGKWWFIFNHHVLIMVPRKSMEERHTFDELSHLIIPRFVKDGLIVYRDCEMYYPIIETDTWFKPSRLEEHRRDFLLHSLKTRCH